MRFVFKYTHTPCAGAGIDGPRKELSHGKRSTGSRAGFGKESQAACNSGGCHEVAGPLAGAPVLPANVADPFDTVQWDLRTAAIKGEAGEVLFEQPDCEIPAAWSQLATNVVVSKYFYGEISTPERESSVRQLIHRVSRTIADWGMP